MTGKQAVNYLYSSGFSDEQVKTVVEAIRKDPCFESGWYEGMNKEESLKIIKAYRDKLKNSVSNQLEDDIAAFDVIIEASEQEPNDFAKWVATEIFDDNWEYNKDAFAELACRKLTKLGIVRANGDEWELVDPQGSEVQE